MSLLVFFNYVHTLLRDIRLKYQYNGCYTLVDAQF